jgi:hypothetical protein
VKTFANLKSRLEALPSIREGRQHDARYAAFLANAISATEKLQKALNASTHAAPVLPALGYDEALKTIRSVSKRASRLRDKLNIEPAAVAESSTEESFTRLFEDATLALKSCQSAWETELQAKIKDWEAIQDVVAKLMPAQGGRLKKAIWALQTAKNDLPLTKEAAAETRSHLDDLKDSIANLDLQGPFGEFLRAAASPDGADLNLLLNEEVSKVIAKHQLQKVFRVRLSS